MQTQTGENWVKCGCGQKHWGTYGAAGLLLVRTVEGTIQVLLQHRSSWTDHGDTWSIPGGALNKNETPVHGALRETHEETGISPRKIRVVGDFALNHKVWKYTTILGVLKQEIKIVANDESHELAWVNIDDVQFLRLHPLFAQQWSLLRNMAKAVGSLKR